MNALRSLQHANKEMFYLPKRRRHEKKRMVTLGAMVFLSGWCTSGTMVSLYSFRKVEQCQWSYAEVLTSSSQLLILALTLVKERKYSGFHWGGGLVDWMGRWCC